MTPALPRSATVAWWLTAWLRGQEQADHALDAFGDVAHLLAPLGDETATESLVDLVGRLRRSGVSAAGLALPVEGDLLGLGGPPDFNSAALEAGQAVVAGDLGIVPWETSEVVHWRTYAAARRQLPDVGEADRALRSALVASADALAALDVARWRPEVADVLLDLRPTLRLDAPLGTPPRCVEVAARGMHAWSIVDLALQDDGGALSAYEVQERRLALVPLERAARRAVVAACSPEVWPD